MAVGSTRPSHHVTWGWGPLIGGRDLERDGMAPAQDNIAVRTLRSGAKRCLGQGGSPMALTNNNGFGNGQWAIKSVVQQVWTLQPNLIAAHPNANIPPMPPPPPPPWD